MTSFSGSKATGRKSSFESRQRQSIETGCGMHVASCPLGTGILLPGGKRPTGDDGTYSHLVWRVHMFIALYVFTAWYSVRLGSALLTHCTTSVYFDCATEERFFDFKQKQNVSALPKASRPSLGPTQYPVQWVQAAFSARIEQPVHEIELPSSSAKVKN
jgi:hypothetical protein